MKVLSILEKETMAITDEERPVCLPGHALIKMAACGICGSDVTAYKGVNPTVKYPINGLGHEGIGEIVEINTEKNEFQVGDRVALEPYVPCYECDMCKQERFNNCENLKVCGVHKNGMMAEYFLHPIKLLYKIPEDLSNIDATLIEPLTIGLHALTRAQVKADEYCLIFGAGTIGLLTALGAKIYGATPILVDIVDQRLEFAKEVGIEHTINSLEKDIIASIKEATGGKLPQSMIECTGAQAVLRNIHEYVAHGGRVSLVGWPHDVVPFNQIRIMQKEISIFGSRNSNKKFPESMEYIHKKMIPTDKIITKVIELEEVESLIKEMIKKPENFLKVVVNI
ncbi:zinc-dependent alcohol dehydrogenase [Amphibacillus sp. Q70]|uniref:zinc-dependent alcohol dehydrogenase n=1 Tax=Amphibacillus sp. Q70 TaxID=3453416 RepID=UPI003F83A2BC